MEATSLKTKVGVKAVILRDKHLLTVVKQYPEGISYILPGGSQNHGETLDAAIQRECREELGVEVTVNRLLFVREYIGANHEYAAIDGDLHIVDILFACNVPPDYTPHMGSEPDSDQIGVEWLPLLMLQKYRFYPRELHGYLQNIGNTALYVGDIN